MKIKRIVPTLALAISCAISASASAADTIKVGVLHSLSGTMAISETTLKDTVLMMVEEQNKKGGLLGKQLEAVVVDPASNWPLFRKANRWCTPNRCCSSIITNPNALNSTSFWKSA